MSTNPPRRGHLLRNPTSSYRPAGQAFGDLLAASYDGKPWYNWLDRSRMMRDPRVCFALRMWRAPFQQVAWKVKAESGAVARFVDSTLRKYWRRAVPRLLYRYCQYGFAAAGFEWAARRGKVRLDRVRVVECRDARPLVYAGGRDRGRFAGFRLYHAGDAGAVRVGPEHAAWYAGQQEYGEFYDRPLLAGMFDPWAEKNVRGGALDTRRLGHFKYAFSGDTIRHPPGVTNVGTDESPSVRDNQDLAREALEQIASGSGLTLPNTVNPGDPGKYEWTREPGVSNVNLDNLLAYPKDLDAEILEGAGIPAEVLEASEVGSGWSGRMVPLQAFFGSIDEHVGPLLDAAEPAVRYATRANFGNAFWEVEPVPLTETLKRAAQSGPGGGEGPNPVGQLLGRGGPNGPGGTALTKPVAMSEERGAAAVARRLMGRRKRDLVGLVVAGMVQEQLRATRAGAPDSAADTLDGLSALAGDPDKVNEILSAAVEMSWAPYTGPRGGVGWISDTGRVVYGTGHAPGERRERQKAVAAKARAILSKAIHFEASPADLQELSDHLPALTVAQLRTARVLLAAKFGGGRRRQQMVDKLVEHVKGRIEDEKAKAAGGGNPEAADANPKGVDGGKPGRRRAGDGRVPEPPAGGGGAGAGEAERPGDTAGGQSGRTGGQPAREATRRDVPAEIGRVNEKIDRFRGLLRNKGQHQVADWLDRLKDHVNTVGVQEAVDALGPDRGGGKQPGVEYEGGWDKDAFDRGDPGHGLAAFCEAYLNRNGITMTHQAAGSGAPLISSASPAFGGSTAGPEGSFLPKDPTLANKLEEAKKLPGLEKSEDVNAVVGKPVTHLTPDVMAKMDERYGAGKWIIKAYGDDAAAGYGIFFPQRAAQIAQDARNTLWAAGENVARYGFGLDRDPKTGAVVGLKHHGGDRYEFGTPKYENTIHGDVRHWGDRAAAAAGSEHGAELPGGGKEFMAQPAFAAVGVSDADRAAGKTIAPGEGRVHIVTRGGKAELVPHATWIKGEPLPVVFEDDDTRAMAKAAVDAINALPESERQGQIYAPDVLKAADGYRVVEANPANNTGSSGYLGNNPLVIDSYVSHLTGRTPAHVQFIRKLLTERNKSGGDDRGQARKKPDGADQRGRPGGGPGRPGGVAKDDPGGAGGVDPTQPGAARTPGRLAEALRGVGRLPDGPGDGGRWDHPPEVRDAHNRQVLDAAKKSGVFIPPESLARVTASPNVGGMEHDVHEDAANDRFFKFTKGGHFGQNKDVHEYLERHKVANELWPELDHRFHGVTRSPSDGTPQLVMSMNRVEGTHPGQAEIEDWFKSHGWVSNEDEPDEENGTWSWRDPRTGTVINDAHAGNFIKTAKGLVPIDVDILPGRGRGRELSDARGHDHAPAGTSKGGQFVAKGGGGGAKSAAAGKAGAKKSPAAGPGTAKKPGPPANNKGGGSAPAGTGPAAGEVAAGEVAAARAAVAAKVAAAPVPTPDAVAKARAELERAKAGEGRAGGDSRGGSAADRRRQRKNLFAEFGGGDRGYVVCHVTGVRMHWTDDPAENPHGYPLFERGKIFVKRQGGGYQLPNLIPESFTANRSRNDTPVRPENLGAGVNARVGGGATSRIAGAPTEEHRAAAAKWVAASPGVGGETAARYADDMSHALSVLPAGVAAAAARSMAGVRGPKGVVGAAVFHPDVKSLRARAVEIEGKKSAGAGVSGFAHDRGAYTDVHLDGGDDPRGTYVHELWHAADNQQVHSGTAGWHAAYKSDILGGGPNKKLLSRYAMESPVEGFAEFGRVLAERGGAYMAENHPACVEFLKSRGLL